MKNGTKLRSVANREYIIRRFIAAGGQGEVYEAEDSATKTAYALKWYFKHSATDYQRKLIKRILDRGAPDERFLWPLDMVEAPKGKGKNAGLFGYIMRLRPFNYKSIIDLMKRRAEPTFGALCLAGINLADGYHSLHSNGLCYRDISFGNLFFNPANGDVLICDNDNVTVNRDSEGGTDGTPRFIAPEIITGKKSPSTETDLYSMAVLLFYMFMLHHPLEGAKEANIKCFDSKAMEKIYGREPLFIWHPTDKSNRPVPGYQDNAIIFWKIYPQFIRDMFTAAFTDGLFNPSRRIVEKQWKEAFSRLHSSIVLCQRCNAENFAEDGRVPPCWSCKSAIALPPKIQIAGATVMLNRDTKLYAYGANGLFDYTAPIGQVQQHPSDPGKWGIKNIGGNSWVYIRANGEKAVIEPGRAAPIVTGAKISFGNVDGLL
ncbi:MAG: hypothetical protein FWE68_04215 [Defluviitaleaceae bacterium]|nr:hypothetical protein [Defluviitaleaceae bacterium]